MKKICTIAVLLVMGGCAARDNIITGPELSPVGEGIVVNRQPLPVSFVEPEPKTFQSLWSGKKQVLFTDRKARQVGDVITVNIQINDKAQFDNQSDRSRDSKSDLSFGGFLGFGGFNVENESGEASGGLNVASKTSTKGEGSIDRSEKLRLSIAALVTEELPNGNLMISGSQEVKVNNEVRVLNIAGIVRLSDISTDNSVSYDKIAEARISYGGRGRISDMQQPAWGQRIYDKVVPF
ncbi:MULTISPECIES: flagellar basal body L-ring protein FlgH [Afifella]|uniref:flagellar basal body L-ring protein FlgH n=1 Tax=Afifella TaxID=643217 RepID=UPI000FE4275A|nr:MULTISPECIES: flagellar basal body L-ring protein FlgH [Afifella]MCT8267832.1 flagellar basal body L-ring protein FlgH [Afifella sp. JA880]